MREIHLEYHSIPLDNESGKSSCILTSNGNDETELVVMACELLLMAMTIEMNKTEKSKNQIFNECINHLHHFILEDTHTNITSKVVNVKDEMLNNINEN